MKNGKNKINKISFLLNEGYLFGVLSILGNTTETKINNDTDRWQDSV